MHPKWFAKYVNIMIHVCIPWFMKDVIWLFICYELNCKSEEWFVIKQWLINQIRYAILLVLFKIILASYAKYELSFSTRSTENCKFITDALSWTQSDVIWVRQHWPLFFANCLIITTSLALQLPGAHLTNGYSHAIQIQHKFIFVVIWSIAIWGPFY